MTMKSLRLGTAALAFSLGACAAPAPEIEAPPCAPNGELHNHGGVDECDCNDGFVADGLRCIKDPRGNDPGEGEGEGESVEGCGVHGDAHGNHCDCDAGYVEIEGVCVAPPTCVGPDDPHEPNDGPDAAISVEASGGALHACPFDEDWFQIDAAAGETVVVDVVFAQADGDLDVYVWAAGVEGEATYAAEPVGQGISDDDDERVSFISMGGTHLFVVLGFEAAEAPYTVVVTQTAP